MTDRDVRLRSDIAQFLGKDVWPADKGTLVEKATDNGAPDGVLAMLGRLPEGQQFGNMQDVSRALGIGTEEHGF